jgi:hypothetical protein
MASPSTPAATGSGAVTRRDRAVHPRAGAPSDVAWLVQHQDAQQTAVECRTHARRQRMEWTRARRSTPDWRRPSAAPGLGRPTGQAARGRPRRRGPTLGKDDRRQSASRGSGSSGSCGDQRGASEKRASSRSRRTVGSGSQISGTSPCQESSASTRASMRSVLHAKGARPLTRCASAISTSQPCASSASCTNRAPFIDSTTPRTGRDPRSARPGPPSRRRRPAPPAARPAPPRR